AGRQLPDGSYELGSLNDRNMLRLRYFADTMKEYGMEAGVEMAPEEEEELVGAGVYEDEEP
ncbi:MAG TPA: hypothetical protein VHR86_04955, partial [Armatimonadota bacterium]|nr:hypothetical protein [Armatimonadota bacterium]